MSFIWLGHGISGEARVSEEKEQMTSKDGPLKVENRVLQEIIDEIQREKENRPSFPFWNNWNNWMNWINWMNWMNWYT